MIYMGESKVFLITVIAGFLTRLGIPDIGEIILNVWDSSKPSLLYFLPPDLHIYISIIAIIVILIAAYFLFEPLINGFQYGLGGIVIVIVGFILGFIIAGVMISYFNSLFGLPSYD